MKKLIIALILASVTMSLICVPVSALLPTEFLDEEVRIIFDADLPSGKRYILGRILGRNEDWIVLISQTNRVYLCNVDHIVCIEIETNIKEVKNENISLDADGAADIGG